MMNVTPDLTKVVEWSNFIAAQKQDVEDMLGMHQEAQEFLEYYDWCSAIKETFCGLMYPGIVAVFLFRIATAGPDVDEWVWVVVGDLPPAYLTVEECPNPATALDGYNGAMQEWVDAATKGKSVADIIPVNVPATPEHAAMLRSRIEFLEENILSLYQEDLRA